MKPVPPEKSHDQSHQRPHLRWFISVIFTLVLIFVCLMLFLDFQDTEQEGLQAETSDTQIPNLSNHRSSPNQSWETDSVLAPGERQDEDQTEPTPQRQGIQHTEPIVEPESSERRPSENEPSQPLTEQDEDDLPDSSITQELHAPRPTAPGYRIRWSEPGLCSELDYTTATTRSEYLGLFEPTEIGEFTIYLDRTLPNGVAQFVALSAESAAQNAENLTGLLAEPPPIYVYRDVESLRATACVGGDAVAFYDGAIHVSGDIIRDGNEIWSILAHEYIHHILTSNDIRYPTWLQEGLAMLAAGENWWRRPEALSHVINHPFPLAHMTWVFPHGTNEQFAITAYVESMLMVQLVIALHDRERLRLLISELASGHVSPEDSFQWACALSDSELVAAWYEYLRGMEQQILLGQ